MHRFDVAPPVEDGKIELFSGLRGPETQEIDGVGAEARGGNVMRHTENFFGVNPARAVGATVVENVFDPAIKIDLLRIFRSDNFPRVAENDPVVGMLNLVAIDKFLLKKAELVVDAVAERG